MPLSFEGRLVARDAAGVGDELLPPFSATGPWELAWENHSAGAGLTVAGVSNLDGFETVLINRA